MGRRWLVLVGGWSLGALALSALPPCSAALRAQAGCCKTRNAAGAPWAKRPDLTLAACQDLNAQDKDDLFEERGRVWWDRACR
ncbi:MAG: hypothetical protein L0027_04755 [Candidatus Rokubacteria bacterium]|nr:hypothetical protein [Candidatus Rokubacteria bacterium]